MAVGIQHPIPASATSPKYQSYHVTTTKKSELSVASTVGDGHLDDFTTTAAAAATAAFVAAAAKAAYPDQHAEMGPGNGAVDVGELVQPAAMYAAPETKLDKPVFVGSISDQLKVVLAMIDVDECDVDGEGAFFVADLAEVYRQHLRWVKELPRIVPFYAVKCNPDPYVLRLLAALGTGFDCASNGEIQSVLDIGVSPSRVIYANPCKASSFVRQSAKQRVALTTFDNLDELSKIKKFHPKCKLVVRILTDDSKSVCQLGLKFGAPLDSVPRLLTRAKELDLDVVGVSFHVGSGCYDPESFRDAVRRARTAFDMGKEHGFSFDLLDVGGGYDHGNFEMIAEVLRRSLDEFFPEADFSAGGSEMADKTKNLRIIAEPGRYYVQRAFVLAANIIARRDGRTDAEEESCEEDDAAEEGSTPGTDSSASTAIESIDAAQPKPQVMLYQNDGVYGAFNCIMFDHQVVHPKVLSLHRQFAYRPDLDAPGIENTSIEEIVQQLSTALTLKAKADAYDKECIPCSVWGPTCDSIDCVRDLAFLPRGLDVGDWLIYENMGAYTICAASSFNGLRRSEVRYTVGAEGEDAEVVKKLLALEAR